MKLIKWVTLVTWSITFYTLLFHPELRGEAANFGIMSTIGSFTCAFMDCASNENDKISKTSLALLLVVIVYMIAVLLTGGWRPF